MYLSLIISRNKAKEKLDICAAHTGQAQQTATVNLFALFRTVGKNKTMVGLLQYVKG